MQATKENAEYAIQLHKRVCNGGGFLLEFLEAAKLKLPTQKSVDTNNKRKKKRKEEAVTSKEDLCF